MSSSRSGGTNDANGAHLAPGTDEPSRAGEFGVGPAYPTAHTRFTDTADTVSADAPRRRPGSDAAGDGEMANNSDAAAPGHRRTDGDDPDGDAAPVFAPSPHFTVADGLRDVGMVFVGASTTAGYGDPKGLGWVGRVVARTQHPDLDLTAYNLGVRGDTSGDVVGRWQSECEPRWAHRAERRLVLSVGANDLATGMTMARSRLNLANIIDEAVNAGVGVFVVGLAPTLEPELNRRIDALAAAQADVCSRRGVTYVDCYRPLVSHDQWMADIAASPDRVHPGQAGYGLIAWLVLHNGWNDWLSIS